MSFFFILKKNDFKVFYSFLLPAFVFMGIKKEVKRIPFRLMESTSENFFYSFNFST